METKIMRTICPVFISVILFCLSPSVYADGLEKKAVLQGEIEKAVKDVALGDRQLRKKAETYLRRLPKTMQNGVFAKFNNGVDYFKKTLPSQIDEVTVLSEVMIVPEGAVFFYDLDIEKVKYDSPEYKEVVSTIKKQLVNSQCTISLSALYLMYGKTISVYYTYTDRTAMFDGKITWADCKARP